MNEIIAQYLDLLDSQRETAFSTLVGLTEQQIWQRPSPREWCLGEILDHNYLLISSTLPYVKWAWRKQQRRSERRRDHPYITSIDDPYRKASFPMWVGFLWRPRYTPNHPVSLEDLLQENRSLHQSIRTLYCDKEAALLGNTFVYDPLFGSINLIITLRIGIYHDQLHFDDVLKMATALKS
jgi:hypothetical protein